MHLKINATRCSFCIQSHVNKVLIHGSTHTNRMQQILLKVQTELLSNAKISVSKGKFFIPKKAKLEKLTFGNPMVKGTVRTARPLETFFMVPATGFPSIPSCILHWGTIRSQLIKIGTKIQQITSLLPSQFKTSSFL